MLRYNHNYQSKGPVTGDLTDAPNVSVLYNYVKQGRNFTKDCTGFIPNTAKKSSRDVLLTLKRLVKRLRANFCFGLYDPKRVDCQTCQKKADCEETKKDLEMEMSIW